MLNVDQYTEEPHAINETTGDELVTLLQLTSMLTCECSGIYPASTDLACLSMRRFQMPYLGANERCDSFGRLNYVCRHRRTYSAALVIGQLGAAVR
jgi:hypothetical protein